MPPNPACSETALSVTCGRRLRRCHWYGREGISQLLGSPCQVLALARRSRWLIHLRTFFLECCTRCHQVIDHTGDFVGGRHNRLLWTQPCAQRALVRPKRGIRTPDRRRGIAERRLRTRASCHRPRPAHLPTRAVIAGCYSEPGAKMLHRREARHIGANLADTALHARGRYAHHRHQIHPHDAAELRAHSDVGLILRLRAWCGPRQVWERRIRLST